MEIIFLGTSSAVHSKERNHPSIALKAFGDVMLFDCGEGTQRQILYTKVSPMKISKIFITHYHGDHILGLPGLLQSMSLHGRESELTIYGPKGLNDIKDAIYSLGSCAIDFPVEWIEIDTGTVEETEEYIITAQRVRHNVPCLAYSIEEKKKPRFLREKAIELGVPVGPAFGRLHNGEEVEIDGRIIKPEQVLGEPRKGIKITYSGDTRPCEEMITIENGNDESDKAIRPVIEVKKTKIYYGLKANVTFNDEERLTVKTIDLGSTVTPVDNQGKTNYHFKHWSLTKNGAEFNFNTSISEDITLYAVYEIDRYNITYNLDGGVVTGNPSTYTPEDTFTLNNPTKEGYKFLGWIGTDLTDKTMTVTVPVGSTGDREYTANYEEIEDECKIYIASSVYSVDNDNLVISGVPKDETEEQIESNLNIEGKLEKITSETVTVSCNDTKKVYTIQRIWMPHTGMNIIKFSFIFLYSAGIITVLMFINRERLKNKLLKVSIRNKKE